MHPALIVLIIVGVPLGGWAAYEGAQYIHEWWKTRQERKDYEEFVRSHYMNEKNNGYFSDDNDHLLHTDDEDDEDDEKPLARTSSNVWGRRGNDLRNRRQGGWEHYKMSETELVEMEKSIEQRRMYLEQERAMLDKAETDLQRQRQSIQSRGNSLMGMPCNDSHSTTDTTTNSVESSSLMTQVPDQQQQQQHWNFAHPPPPPSPPQGTPVKLDMEESDFAMLRSHTMIHDADDEDEEDDKLRMPSAPMHARNESDESSWADVSSDHHHREQSDASDLSFNSIKTSSGHKSDSSFGVRSISSDEGLL